MCKHCPDGYTGSGLPRTVTNPVMGASATFDPAYDESDDGSATAICREQPWAKGPPLHYHLDFEETFTCLEGTLFMDLGDRRNIEVRPGESVHVPRGVHHRYYNDSDQPCTFRVLAKPGRTYEHSIRIAYGMAADGATNAKGLPRNPLDLALVFDLSGSYLVGVPLWLQMALSRVGVAIARMAGRDPAFLRYTKADRLEPDL